MDKVGLKGRGLGTRSLRLENREGRLGNVFGGFLLGGGDSPGRFSLERILVA